MQDVSSTIQRDIRRLEVGLRELKIQYDMFFAGAIPKEPSDLRHSLERLIKRNANASIRKYSDRFHFNTLVSRFNSLSELWGRTVREREEGHRTNRVIADRRAERNGVVAACGVKDPVREEEHLRALHARFTEAREKTGQNGNVSFEAFFRGITSQVRSLKDKTGCDQIELRVVVEQDKVQLRARPRRS